MLACLSKQIDLFLDWVTYLIERVLGSFKSYVPQEHIIVVLQSDACTELIVLLYVYVQKHSISESLIRESGLFTYLLALWLVWIGQKLDY